MASDSKAPRLRWIPINEIPLHDRPSREALLCAAEGLQNMTGVPVTWASQHLDQLKSVQRWLIRVASIPEDSK